MNGVWERVGWAVRGEPRRAVWVVLGVWSVLCVLMHAGVAGYSWHYFRLGAHLLTGAKPIVGGGLHVYAAHPELQIGPVALAAAVPFAAAAPTFGLILAILSLTALALLLLKILVSVAELSAPVPDTLLLMIGGCLLPVWAELAAHFTHLDDGLTLAFAVLAVHAVRTHRPVAAGLLIAAAIDCKPWAVAFAPLLMALTPAQRTRGAISAVSGVVLAWLPFVAADPRTASLGHFSIVNAADSGLRALGVNSAGTPSWDRLAQAVLGVIVAVWVVRRGRWPAVLLAGVAVRMLLDPQTYPYYTAGLLVAAATVDLLRPERQLPFWTMGAFGFYTVTTVGKLLFSSAHLGELRVAYLLVVLALLCAPGPQAAGPTRRRGTSARQSTGQLAARDLLLAA